MERLARVNSTNFRNLSYFRSNSVFIITSLQKMSKHVSKSARCKWNCGSWHISPPQQKIKVPIHFSVSRLISFCLLSVVFVFSVLFCAFYFEEKNKNTRLGSTSTRRRCDAMYMNIHAVTNITITLINEQLLESYHQLRGCTEIRTLGSHCGSPRLMQCVSENWSQLNICFYYFDKTTSDNTSPTSRGKHEHQCRSC